MSRLRLILALAAILPLAACGGSDTPQTPAPPGGGGETITGTERLGWEQPAADAGTLATFGFAIYVDTTRRVEASDVTCGSSIGTVGFPCSARLPTLTPGGHTIQIAAFVLDSSGTPIESARSTPIQVTLRSLTTGATDAAGARARATAEGTPLAVRVLDISLEAPTDLAFAPDGRLFVAERHGRIRVLGDTTADSRAPAIDDAMAVGDTGGLVAIALDPAFERTHYLYALYTAEGRDGAPVFRLARLREAAGTFGERAVLLDNVAAARDRPSGTMRFGIDGKLYAAFDDGGSPDEAMRPGSQSGKILRLNADGTTPEDQPGRSPVHVSGAHAPRALDWHPVDRTIWLVDGARADGGPDRVFGNPAGSVARSASVHALPVGAAAASATFYRGTLIPELAGDLLVADEGGALLRLRFTRRSPLRLAAIDRLLETPGSSVRAVAVGPDGGVYVATPTAVLRLGI
jgi:glucose/arabinose dehydrogenase